MRVAIVSLCLLAAGVSAAQETPAPRVEAVDARIDRPRANDEEQLRRYLEDLLGWPATDATVEEAERRVLRLPRYANASCRMQVENGRGRLSCDVTRARVIRTLRFEGLPAQILETDIRKRLFLRPGEPLALGEAAHEERIARQRERLEDYLMREGFYGATVDLRTTTIPSSGDLEVVIAVRGGSFVSVREVNVASWLPLSRQRVFDEYSRMCAGGDGWLGLFETWRVRCYTRQRLSETTARLEEELRQRGYPEARISVQSTLVDASDAANGRCAFGEADLARFREENLPVPPRCVDLEVKVVPGRHLVTTIALYEGRRVVAERTHTSPFLESWEWLSERVRNAFFLEEISRLLQLVTESPVSSARDTRVHLRDLEAQLTFTTSGAVDDTEVELSRRALLHHLATRGYLSADVKATRVEEGERVEVRFDIRPGRVTTVREILLVGNQRFSDEELLENVELVSRPRSLVSTGFVTRQDIEDDVQRLFRFYEDRGYRDASISARASPRGDDLTITFYIDEGEPYVLGGARFRGGDPAVNIQVLTEIVHCKGGIATQQKRSPLTPKDCVGSPLRPEELAADSERVRAVYARAGFPYVDARVGLAPEWTDEGPILDIVIWQRKDGGIDEDGEREEAPAALPSTEEEIDRPIRVSRGEIFLEGNFRTQRHAILNEMGLSSEPELRLDPLAISEGISRLRRTGLFSRVDYDYVGREERRRELDVVVQVEERKAGTVDFAVAYSTQDLGQLRAEWRDRNLFGLMLDFGVRADYGLFIGRESRLEAPFRWPRILGSNVSLRIEPSAIYSDHPSVVVPREPTSDGLVPGRAIFHSLTRRRIFSTGGRFAVDWSSPPALLSGLSAGLEYEIRAEWDDPAAEPIPLLGEYPLGPITLRLPSQRALETVDGLLTVFDQPLARVGVLTPKVRYSAVQNPFDPVSGWTGELSFSVGHPWLGDSTTTFLIQGRAAFYRPFAQNFVLALHGRGWGGVTDVMPGGRSFLLRPDLLSLGGDRTVRGYSATALNEQFGVPELAVEVAEGTRGGPIPLVGALGNAELRWTAIRNLFLGDLKLAGFVDAGFVTDDEALTLASLWNPIEAAATLANMNRAGVGVGAGIRYVLPVGPLSLDLAFAPVTRNVQLHLQFGYVF